MEAESNPLGWPTWLWRCLVALMLVLAAYSVTGSFTNFARASGLLRDFPDMGFAIDPRNRQGPDWFAADDIVSGGPADLAGIEQGDLVRIGPADLAAAFDGKPIAAEVIRDDKRFHTQIDARLTSSFNGLSRPLLFFLAAVSLLTIALSAALLAKSRGNRAAVMLGTYAIFLTVTFYESTPGLPLNLGYHIGLERFLALIFILTNPLPGYLWPLIALEISGGASKPRQAKLVHAAALGFAVAMLMTDIPFRMGALSITGWTASAVVQLITNQILGYGIILWNYRSQDAPGRNRLRIVLVAFLLLLAAHFVRLSDRLLLGSGDLTVVMTVFVLLSFAALALLTYAVLRQRLFDLNFALNRTLVYAAVSFVVLAAFGLAKWVIEHLIPESWHEGSEYYSVGIALGLFLILHRVHDWVERTVERFLFSPWHRNEEALRRFVGAAGHFDQTPVLCRAFAEELSRFAKGAGAALYLRARDGSYALAHGNLADAQSDYAGDDLALALMRAERKPLRTAEARSELPGALALPMLDHGKLVGFALLDGKPDGTDFRPDEIEALCWAAHQVGLDLQAMRASELEGEVAALHARIAALGAQLAATGTRRRTRASTGSAA